MLGYLYWLTKFADLFDTFFFALRKKNSHISFLHLYHHISVPILGWIIFKFNAQMPIAYFFILLNGIVHIIMYSYYALSSFGPQIQRYLWWKRYITQLQLFQFIIFGVYALVLIFKQVNYPKVRIDVKIIKEWKLIDLCSQGLLLIGIPQPIFFFYMFYDFYRRTYKKKTA